MLDDIRNKAQSWGIKIIFGIIILVFVFWGVGNMGGGSDSSLAVVNGETITMADYQKVLERNVSTQLQNNPEFLSDPAVFNEFKKMLLDEMAWGKARQQEAIRLGIMVTPHELKKRLYSMPYFQDGTGRFDEERYRMVLDAMRMKPDQYLAELEDDIRETKLMAYIGMSSTVSEAEAKLHHTFGVELRFADYVLFSIDDFKARAEVGEEEIAAEYEANKESFRRPVRANLEYLALTPANLARGYQVTDEEAEAYYKERLEVFREPERFRAGYIVIAAPPEGSTEPGAEEKIAAARARMEEVVARLKQGEAFADLAREYSDDRESGRVGGELGWLEMGETGLPVINEATKVLEPGQTSDILRSVQGFHLLKMEEKKPSAITPFADVADRIKTEMAMLRADENFAEIQKEAEDALHLGTSLADFGKKLSLEPVRTGLAAEDELNKTLNVTKEYIEVLRSAILEAAASGKATTIPMPLNIKDGIAMVRILDAAPSAIPPLEDVSADIRASLRNAKAVKLAQAAADEALPLFKGEEIPEAYKDKVVKSQGTVRVSESLEPLGPAPELVTQLFFSKGGWLPQVFSTAKGPVIAKLSAVEKPTEERWQQDKANGFIGGYRQWQTNNAVRAFLMELYTRAEVKANYPMLDLIGRRN